MDAATVKRFLDGMKYEAERTAPPEGFPHLPDIPAGRYVDPEFLALEDRQLWKKSWLYACHIDQLPQPGSYLLWKKSGSTILIVRGKDDVVRAFYNTCRHRGAPVVANDERQRERLRLQLPRLDVCARWQADQPARQARFRRARHVVPLADPGELRALLQLDLRQRGSAGRAARAALRAVRRVFQAVPARDLPLHQARSVRCEVQRQGAAGCLPRGRIT